MFSLKNTCKSYLPPLQTEMKKLPKFNTKRLEGKFLPGEIVVSEVSFVRKCVGPDCGPEDLWGKLICTNFKITFVTHDLLVSEKFPFENRLLGEHDVPLACVERVVTVNDARGKQKVMQCNRKLKFHPTELIVYCKDFKILRFRFDEAGPESAKKVCLAIAHYSQPADLRLLFGFEYAGKKCHLGETEGQQQTAMFDRMCDWHCEVKRTGATEWRVCSVNQGYSVSPSLAEYFVVPASLADFDLIQYSSYFTRCRIPVWCWNHPNGSALARMARVTDAAQQKKLEQRICCAITKSHPKRADVLRCDLSQTLPNIQEVQASLVKLRQICVIEPYQECEDRWLSLVESSGWLQHVRAVLQQSVEVVYMLEGKQASVILQEDEDRDLSCVVSSLVQLMLDPHFRSTAGFQSLVQKEWVMGGYRFLDRCNHLKKNDKEESPLFLLFLDCVQQLMKQYPAAFGFTETYLAVLSDSMWIPIFSTFLFNSPRQRAQHCPGLPHSQDDSTGGDWDRRFPPVWDWSLQFSRKDQALFRNPLYAGKADARMQNGAVKTFKRKKNLSSTVRGKPSLPNGSLKARNSLPRRNSFVLRLRADPPEPALQRPADHFTSDWLSRPADPHGLLLPQLLPSHLQLWRFYFLRWVPEAHITHGGPSTALHRLSQLLHEIQTLQGKLRECGADMEQDMSSSTTELHPGAHVFSEYLSSSFPFSPVGNLCRRSALGSPLSKFLHGARLWLSTETLAGEAS